jgi:hypothetical protein
MFIFKKLNIVENNNAEIKQFSLHKKFTGCITKMVSELRRPPLWKGLDPPLRYMYIVVQCCLSSIVDNIYI